MVVIQDGEGSIYGGYADGDWSSGDTSSKCVSSTVAFIYCLASSKTPAAAPFKMLLNGTGNTCAIHAYRANGAYFGADLIVGSDGRVKCSFGSSYTTGPTGATISTVDTVPVAALEVWQLADA